MNKLTNLPNIGATLAKKLESVGIATKSELEDAGSENALIRVAALEESGVCINMLYALEGAIQGKRWHGLDKEKKKQLLEFYKSHF